MSWEKNNALRVTFTAVPTGGIEWQQGRTSKIYGSIKQPWADGSPVYTKRVDVRKSMRTALHWHRLSPQYALPYLYSTLDDARDLTLVFAPYHSSQTKVTEALGLRARTPLDSVQALCIDYALALFWGPIWRRQFSNNQYSKDKDYAAFKAWLGCEPLALPANYTLDTIWQCGSDEYQYRVRAESAITPRELEWNIARADILQQLAPMRSRGRRASTYAERVAAPETPAVTNANEYQYHDQVIRYNNNNIAAIDDLIRAFRSSQESSAIAGRPERQFSTAHGNGGCGSTRAGISANGQYCFGGSNFRPPVVPAEVLRQFDALVRDQPGIITDDLGF